jgi:hypothetical protein
MEAGVTAVRAPAADSGRAPGARRRASRLALAAASSLALVACGDPPEHAPYASGDGNGAACDPGAVLGGGAGGGAGGSPGASADAGVEALSGDLGVFTDTLFFTMRPFVGSGTVGVTSGASRVSAPFDGSGYRVPAVEPSALHWVDLQPASGDDDAMPTLHVVEGWRAVADLGMASRSVLEGILSDLATPRAPSPDLAYLVVTFVDTSGSPLAGISVTGPAAQTVAYDEGPAFSEGPAETQSRGVALLVGVPASRFPGAPLVVSFASPLRALTGTVVVRAAQGAVTFVRAAVL